MSKIIVSALLVLLWGLPQASIAQTAKRPKVDPATTMLVESGSQNVQLAATSGKEEAHPIAGTQTLPDAKSKMAPAKTGPAALPEQRNSNPTPKP